MFKRWIVRCMGVVTLAWVGTGSVHAQPDFPGLPSGTQIPLPLGNDRPDTGGFFSALEFLTISQGRAFGSQTVAVRGIIDSNGGVGGIVNQGSVPNLNFGQPIGILPGTGITIPGGVGFPPVVIPPIILTDTRPFLPGPTTLTPAVPGRFIGSRTRALSTGDLGRTTFTPGMRLTLGYGLGGGDTISFSYMHLFQAKYSAVASLAPPFSGQSPTDPAETFLTSAVFNFPSQLSGPLFRRSADFIPISTIDANGNISAGVGPGSSYGIFNGASVMEISLIQRFNAFDITYRTTAIESEYGRSYVTAGGRSAWIFERFTWRTTTFGVDRDPISVDAQTTSESVKYTNTLSQHLYGPFLGLGHDLYLGNGFSAEVDCSAAMLVNIAKKRAKYQLQQPIGELGIQNKRTANELGFVPNANLAVNMAWRPKPFIEAKIGYNIWTYYNTLYMAKPIDFNYGSLDPGYDNRFIRLYHGLNIGLALTF